MIEAPGVAPISVCLERYAESYKGALSLSERKKPLRHLVGISEELASGTASSKREDNLGLIEPGFRVDVTRSYPWVTSSARMGRMVS